MYDVLIVGCGITGAACAYELSKYKLNVAVIEKENDVATGATKANSAIIHGGYDPKEGTLMAKLNVRGAELAKEICENLDVPYENCGAVVVAFNDEDLKTVEMLKKRGDANGVKNLEVVDQAKLRELEPLIAEEALGALYVPTSSIVSPWEYCLAMAETAVKNGAELFLDNEVLGIEKTADGFVVKTNKGEYQTKYIINAAGNYADKVHDMISAHSFEILPSRGQYFLMDKEEHTRAKHTIFQCPNKNGKGILVSPTVHGNLIVGPDSENVDDCENKDTTSAGLNFVKKTAQRSIPSIDFRNSIRNFAGVRARTNNGDFIIEEAKDAPGFIDAAGICSPGLSAAPAIAEYIAEIIAKTMPLTKKDSFINERHRIHFKELSVEDKTKLIENNPSYGRVVCRCETVTEGEILETFNTPIPPKSVDGVKRRVGAGLGRCQGGFCGPNVVEILAKQLNVSETEIVQEGASSWMLMNL